MCVLEQVLSELGDKPDHVVVLLGFSVDIDGEIWLVGSEIHSLSIFVVALSFKFSCLLDVEEGVFRFWKISGNNLIGLIPFVGSNIHLEGLDKLTSIYVVFLGEIELSNL